MYNNIYYDIMVLLMENKIINMYNSQSYIQCL
jgi:hypothetical protein